MNINKLIKFLNYNNFRVMDFDGIIEDIKKYYGNDFVGANTVSNTIVDVEFNDFIITLTKYSKADEVPKGYIKVANCLGKEIYLADNVECYDINGELIGNCDIVRVGEEYYLDTGEHDINIDTLTPRKLLKIIQDFENASIADGKGSIMNYPIKFINEIDNEPMHEHEPHRLTNNYMQGNDDKVIDIFYH